MASVTAFAGNVPQNYDTYLGPLFFEPYAIDLAGRLQDGAYSNILELACGTGRVTKHLLPKLAPSGAIIATDLNPDMLRIAEERVRSYQVKWSVVDAHEIPFEEATFDLAVCQYGLMFFSDKPKALKEVSRVLKPKSRFYFNTWDSLQHNAVSLLANQALHEVFPEDPPNFFEKGPYSLSDPQLIRQLLADAGFTGISIDTVRAESVISSPDNVISGILDGSPVSAYLKERSQDAKRVRQRLRELLVNQFGDSNMVLPMQALVCVATKP